MQGMALAKAYYEDYGKPMLENRFADWQAHMAAGLVGEGSECFGYDDAFSTDHDFGPGFCIWLSEPVYAQIGAELAQAYDALPKQYRGYQRLETALAGQRVGVWSLERFYAKYTGLAHPPRDNMEWLRIPESHLATCTNGQVFWDGPGDFSAWRQTLLNFYPDDVVKKKLAARCAQMAQTGQYNYGRALKRGDHYAAYLAAGLFVQHTLAAFFLLNRCYMPFYKWAFRATERFHVLKESVEKLKTFTSQTDGEQAAQKRTLIEDICADVVDALNRQGFTRSSEVFLQVQAEELMRGINDSRLRALHILADA